MVSIQDLWTIAFLVFLEGILSVDNALVLALLASHLPKEQQKRALTYGLVGAVFFRLIALAFTTYLIQWRWVKFVGGGYLVFIALKHFFSKSKDDGSGVKKVHGGFWKTVLIIELTDIAFAVDSILAAIALTQKLWLVFTGGFIGVVLIRFAASFFLKFLEKFPGLEQTAYWLVLIIGTKVILEGFHFESIDFHNTSAAPFWIFWGLMAVAFAYGFKNKPNSVKPKVE